MLGDPTVPVEELMPGTAQAVLIVAMSAIALLSAGYAIRESRRRGDAALIFLLVGCGLAVFYEPLGDALVKVYYTERGQETSITAFGRDIPAFIGILYLWYMPAGAYFLLRNVRRGVSARAYWSRWAGFLGFAIFFEMLVLQAAGTTWIYHGTQAFMILDVPFFTPFTYVSFDVAIGVGVAALATFLPRSRQWLIVPAVPLLMVAGHAASSLPVAIALHSGTESTFWIGVGALGSGLAAVLIAYLGYVAVRKPWTPGARLTLGAEPRPDPAARELEAASAR